MRMRNKTVIFYLKKIMKMLKKDAKLLSCLYLIIPYFAMLLIVFEI